MLKAAAVVLLFITASAVLYKMPKKAQGVTESAVNSAPSSILADTGRSVPAVSQTFSSTPAAAPLPVKFTGGNFDGAVFMGDSLIEDYGNTDYLGNASVISSIGVSAYRALTDHKVPINGVSTDSAWIPDLAAAAKPRKIYMMFGSNDLCWGPQMTEKFYTANYSKLIDILKSRCPDAKIYVQSILPITAAVENTKEYPFDNAKIDSFNKALSEMCAKKGVRYLDVASEFKNKDGKLPKDISDDGMHLRLKGYRMWTQYLLNNE